MSYREMGWIVEDEVESHLQNVIRDGVYIGKIGEDQDYIWMVRRTGTDIIHIRSMYMEESQRETNEDKIHRNERFFLVGRFNTDEEYFIEVTREDMLSVVDAKKHS